MKDQIHLTTGTANMTCRGFKRQEGAVIVVALFFVALIAAMSYYMMSRLSSDTYRTHLLLRTAQAEYYAQGSVLWAIEQLRANLRNQKPNKIVDKMPMESSDEINGYAISSKVTDMQSRLNLTNLNTAETQIDFKHLMQLVDVKLEDKKANEIMNAIVDWMKPGQTKNEYNQYYMSLSPPYRAAHRPFVSASELQMVKGMTPELYMLLQPYITTLPVATQVNVQTANGYVIASLVPNMTVETGKAIEKARTNANIFSVAAFGNLDVVKNHKIPGAKITVVSQYFLLETIVKIEKQRLVIYTLLERSGNESKNAVKIVWQSKGIEA